MLKPPRTHVAVGCRARLCLLKPWRSTTFSAIGRVMERDTLSAHPSRASAQHTGTIVRALARVPYKVTVKRIQHTGSDTPRSNERDVLCVGLDVPRESIDYLSVRNIPLVQHRFVNASVVKTQEQNHGERMRSNRPGNGYTVDTSRNMSLKVILIGTFEQLSRHMKRKRAS